MSHEYLPPDQRAVRTLLVVGALLIATGMAGSLLGLSGFFGYFVPGGLLLLAMALGVFVVSRTAGEALARLLTSMYGASGDSTPPPKAYSAIETLVARGAYAEAAAAYRAEIARDPADGESRVRLAELLLSRLGQPAEAASLYAQARDLARDESRRIALSLRLVDIHRDCLHDRGRVIVELRRLVDTHASSPHAVGARAELARLLAQGVEGPGT